MERSAFTITNLQFDAEGTLKNVNCMRYCICDAILISISVGIYQQCLVSERVIVCLYHGENKLHSMRW